MIADNPATHGNLQDQSGPRSPSLMNWSPAAWFMHGRSSAHYNVADRVCPNQNGENRGLDGDVRSLQGMTLGELQAIRKLSSQDH